MLEFALKSRQDSLRKRFGNALQWYNALQDATNSHVDQVCALARRAVTGLDDGLSMKTTTSPSQHSSPYSSVESLPSSPTGPCAAGELRTSRLAATSHGPEHSSGEKNRETPLPAVSILTSRVSITSTTLPSSRLKRACGEDTDEGDERDSSNPFPDPLPRTRPSDYLRSRCPLCFGAEFPSVSVNG